MCSYVSISYSDGFVDVFNDCFDDFCLTSDVLNKSFYISIFYNIKQTCLFRSYMLQKSNNQTWLASEPREKIASDIELAAGIITNIVAIGDTS